MPRNKSYLHFENAHVSLKQLGMFNSLVGFFSEKPAAYGSWSGTVDVGVLHRPADCNSRSIYPTFQPVYTATVDTCCGLIVCCPSEQALTSAVAALMHYDSPLKRWNDLGQTTLHIYQNSSDNAFRVVGNSRQNGQVRRSL